MGNTLHLQELTPKKINKKYIFIYKSVIIFDIIIKKPIFFQNTNLYKKKEKNQKTPTPLFSISFPFLSYKDVNKFESWYINFVKK
jgi:hypothetical protein